MKPWPIVSFALAGFAMSGCGADREPTSTTPAPSGSASATRPIASAPDATAPPPDAPRAKRTLPGARSAPSQAARLPVVFSLRGTHATPPTVTVPAGIPVELTVASADGRGHRVSLRAGGNYRLTVPAGGRASLRIASLPVGRHPLLDDSGARVATLVIGGQPGP